MECLGKEFNNIDGECAACGLYSMCGDMTHKNQQSKLDKDLEDANLLRHDNRSTVDNVSTVLTPLINSSDIMPLETFITRVNALEGEVHDPKALVTVLKLTIETLRVSEFYGMRFENNKIYWSDESN